MAHPLGLMFALFFAWLMLALLITPRTWYGDLILATWFLYTLVGWLSIACIMWAIYG